MMNNNTKTNTKTKTKIKTNSTHSAYLERHESILKKMLAEANIPSVRLKDAIKYALFSGGKRLRPLLVYLCGELLSVDIQCLDTIAAAVEFTHCYSLIHDDLPAMDNDDFRRGKPSCHRAFDEATAILAGDALQIFAMEVLLQQLSLQLDAAKVNKIAYELARATGPAGMVSGQALDLFELSAHSTKIASTHTNEHAQEFEPLLMQVHELKTGKLISACIHMVIAASTVSSIAENKALTDYAYYLGLAFQMQDDYLDCYAPEKLGKSRASDICNEKMTFATCLSQLELSHCIANYYQRAQDALHCFGDKAHNLAQILHDLKKRI